MSSNPLETPQSYLESLVGKIISIELPGNKLISGRLISRDSKDGSLLIRRMADDEPMLISWQAVLMVYRGPDEDLRERGWDNSFPETGR